MLGCSAWPNSWLGVRGPERRGTRAKVLHEGVMLCASEWGGFITNPTHLPLN